MSWCQEALKGVEVCEKLGGVDKQALIPEIPELACTESIGVRGQPSELKHLSNWCEKKEKSISVSSGERNREIAQTVRSFSLRGCRALYCGVTKSIN